MQRINTPQFVYSGTADASTIGENSRGILVGEYYREFTRIAEIVDYKIRKSKPVRQINNKNQYRNSVYVSLDMKTQS